MHNKIGWTDGSTVGQIYIVVSANIQKTFRRFNGRKYLNPQGRDSMEWNAESMQVHLALSPPAVHTGKRGGTLLKHRTTRMRRQGSRLQQRFLRTDVSISYISFQTFWMGLSRSTGRLGRGTFMIVALTVSGVGESIPSRLKIKRH